MAMKEFSYVIKDELGIHARPAGMLAKAAKEYESKIEISAKGKSADIKRLMAVMALGVKQGDEIRVTVSGSDEEQAQKGIREFLEKNL